MTIAKGFVAINLRMQAFNTIDFSTESDEPIQVFALLLLFSFAAHRRYFHIPLRCLFNCGTQAARERVVIIG